MFGIRLSPLEKFKERPGGFFFRELGRRIVSGSVGHLELVVMPAVATSDTSQQLSYVLTPSGSRHCGPKPSSLRDRRGLPSSG